MKTLGTRKKIPGSIAVFGAAGHIGTPLARHVRYRSPDTELRLISSSADRSAQLAKDFPEARCFTADLFDPRSLEAALADVEGVFVVTPDSFDEKRAMRNLVRVLKKIAQPVHVVRIVGFEAETQLRRVPEALRRLGGTAEQHHVAKAVLEKSDLPVTYVNIGASYMDNFLLMAETIKAERRIVWPERLISYIDTRDVGEICANLLLSHDERPIHQFLTINNGQDLLEVSEIAEIFSDLLKVRIIHEPQREAFVRVYGPILHARLGHEDSAARILDFIDYERGSSAFLMLSDLAERILGRKPMNVRAWLMEHLHHFTS